MPRSKISAFVISYNRANILGTCLRALSFADELVVVDKSSTDASRSVAEAYANQVLTVPWDTHGRGNPHPRRVALPA